MQQVYRGRTKALTVGRCIYCGAAGNETKLTHGRRRPLFLGSDVYLEAASCLACVDITKKFEKHVARLTFGHHAYIGTSRPAIRGTAPRTGQRASSCAGIWHREDLVIAEHPYFLAMPI